MTSVELALKYWIKMICAVTQNYIRIKGWGEVALTIVHRSKGVAGIGKPGSISDVRWM